MAFSIFMDVVNDVAKSVRDAIASEVPFAKGYRRKRPYLLESDTVPCVLVAPGAEGERVVFKTFANANVYGYPVAAVVVAPGNAYTVEQHETGQENITTEQTAETELIQVMRLKELVRNTLDVTTLTNVPSVFNGDVVQAPAVEVTGRNAMTYNVSGVTATFWSLETRAA